MMYLNYLKPNTKTYTYETVNCFGTGEGDFKVGIIIAKSYSHRIDKIAVDLPDSFGTLKTKIKISPSNGVMQKQLAPYV